MIPAIFACAVFIRLWTWLASVAPWTMCAHQRPSHLHVQRCSVQQGSTSTKSPSRPGKNIHHCLHSEHRIPRRMPSSGVACQGTTPYVGGRSPSSFQTGALSSGRPMRCPQLQKKTFVFDIILHPNRSDNVPLCGLGCICRPGLRGLFRFLVRRGQLPVQCCAAWPSKWPFEPIGIGFLWSFSAPRSRDNRPLGWSGSL